VPTTILLDRAYSIYADRQGGYGYFKMLKAAKMRAFAELQDDRVATTPDAAGAIRR
jgi:hypothetical protein